jgi:hypothetical protein
MRSTDSGERMIFKQTACSSQRRAGCLFYATEVLGCDVTLIGKFRVRAVTSVGFHSTNCFA